MSRPHPLLLFALAAVAALMLLFPPFEIRLAGATLNMGYGFLLDPPKKGDLAASINISLLLTQWTAVAIIGVATWFGTSKKAGDDVVAPATTTASSDAPLAARPIDALNTPASPIDRPLAHGIRLWHLGLGLCALFVAVAVLRGPISALSGTQAERDRQTLRASESRGTIVQPGRGTPSAVTRDQPTPQPSANGQGHTSTVVADAKPTPWDQIVKRSEYLEGTRAQRDAIRDLYWNGCIVGLIAPTQQALARQAFLDDSAAIDAGLPPPESGSTTVSVSYAEYLRQQQQPPRQVVSPATMSAWCRR